MTLTKVLEAEGGQVGNWMGRKKHHRRGSMTLPMAVVLPVAVLGFGVAKSLAAGKTEDVMQGLTGFHPGQAWNPQAMLPNYGPIAAGFIVHWIASKIGVNKMLGRAKVPVIRI